MEIGARSRRRKLEGRGTLHVLAVLAFLSLGLPDGVLGVAWPSMRRSFELPMSQLGVLLASAMVGYLASSFASGALVARMGVGRLLATSSAATAVSAWTYALAPAWGVVAGAALVAGLGAGAIDAGINAFAAARFSPRLTSWLHASYGVGATLGPLLTGAVLAVGGSWRAAYGLIGLVLMALTASFVRTADRWAIEPTPAASVRTAPALTDALRRPAVWLNVGLFFLYAGLEVGAGQWAYSWLVEGRGVAPDVAGAWVAVYWGSLTTGRVVLGALTSRIAVETLLRASLAGVPLGVIVLWAGIGPASGAAGLALLGLALAPIYPLLIVATPERVGARYATYTIGFQVAGFYLGTAALPGAAGVLARYAGLEILGPFLLSGALVLLVLHEVDVAARVPPGAPGGPAGATTGHAFLKQPRTGAVQARRARPMRSCWGLMMGLVLAVAASTDASGQVLDKKTLSFEAAQKIAAAAAAEARARGVGVVIAVVDDGGHLILLHRLDDTQVASVNVGIGKARTAAIYRRPSKVFEDQIRAGRVAALALADSTPLQGGVPITLDGKVIGAVGVSGDTPQVDEAIALAGAAAFGR